MTKPRKRRNKPHIKRPKYAPMIIGAQLVIAPLAQIIDQIDRDGTVTTNLKGEAMFQDGDGRWYDTAAVLEGVIWHLEMWCTRHTKILPVQPLRELHACLKYMSPVTESVLARLQAALPVIQRAMALGDPRDQVDIVQQARIKEAFELQGITQ